MALHRQPRQAPRHGAPGARVAVRDLAAVIRQALARPGSVLVKATAVSAAGALAIALAMPGQSSSAVAAEPQEHTSAPIGSASALIYERADQRAGRASSRATALPAVALQAPVLAAPLAAPSFGEMRFTAVEKPPPPPPVAAASPASSGSGSSGAARGSGYDWAAANACSCARGLTQNSMAVLAAVKYSFPGMTNIGGVRPDSIPGHPQGRALDFMTSDRAYGDAIANMLISRAGELNIENIIWRQRVWLPSSGWKSMSDRGGATANHYDHVHVTVR